MRAAQIVLLPLREKVAGEARRMRGLRRLGRQRRRERKRRPPHPPPLCGATFARDGRRKGLAGSLWD